MQTAEKNGIADKFVGFCGDNCAKNFGSSDRGGQNNVYYRLKTMNPSMVGVGCAAHIAHNGLKNACGQLPLRHRSENLFKFYHKYCTR